MVTNIFEFSLEVGDIVICSSQFGSPILFSKGCKEAIFGEIVGLPKGELGLVVESLSQGAANEHVVKIITPKGIGYTWRGFLTRVWPEVT